MNLNAAPKGRGELPEFDPRSGSFVERAIFNHRLLVVLLCTLLTLFFASQLRHLQLSASFEKMIPQGHPYIQNFRAHEKDLVGLGNAVRIALANPAGSIYDARYLDALRQLNDEVFLLPGVNRMQMKSLWTPTTRWAGVTEDGLEGGPVIPEGYDGSAKSLQRLAANLMRSGEIGRTVATDFRSTAIYVPLLSTDAQGRPLDYAALSKSLDQLRDKYQAKGYPVHITGFAKLVGDLIDGVRSVALFFAITLLVSAAVLFWYTRCWRSTAAVVVASLIAVVWQLGMLPILDTALDPYSILVPFLVFAIGMSHGSQKMNGILQDVGRGADKRMAARLTFRRLFGAGLAALVIDAVGFAVLLVIDIQVIRELALAASIGVAILVFTNLILLPVMLSYVGVSPAAAARSLKSEQNAAMGGEKHPVWRFLDRFTERRWASAAIAGAVLLAVGGWLVAHQLQIGDLDPGAPELRQDSRYNRDVAYLNEHYGASSDVLAVMVKTPAGYCSAYDTLNKVDELEWQLRQLPGVDSTDTLALLTRRMSAALNEGNPKWYDFVDNQDMLNTITAGAPRGLYDDACSLLTLYVYLADHKAATLARVVQHVEAFARANDTKDVQFQLAAGSAGIEAATNIVVANAWRTMNLLVYAIVALLALITFRSWRAVIVAILPLMLTSVLAESLMVVLGMGVKVATLPVIALGVGIGVDYALYILSIMLVQLKAGQPLSVAYYRALTFTGKVVMLTGITLSLGVATWLGSPIKFQADMGALLAFMFLWNMLGAMVLVPSLSYFLLGPGKAREARGEVLPGKLLTGALERQ
ncbi:MULTISPECIES: RND family transporter [unclassified Pseudomonas]|uniref:efflux RND transporter permease subunit n=1 Tax=unclassified Pseudomonas TaxID=196821 RepID=UPI0002A28BFE|nr:MULTISPECIES: MMPL family transporter [unclassified Pseudomonas]MBB1606074.1 RND transporter [Pseudomonas sp. UMC76]MBB1636547.1 RND transporter [Pseudomonas sp. UME83]NTX92711.1 RND family transporter [Pseudomonas sp. UMA643]NTY19929.1 RND family transporter [Pseudomonas sp. UMC3103]NTY27338.1 RND family transporter [Pseudomonas sp. UMA603]